MSKKSSALALCWLYAVKRQNDIIRYDFILEVKRKKTLIGHFNPAQGVS